MKMKEGSATSINNVSPAQTVTHSGYYGEARREMLPFVPARRAHVLEIGCGEGRFSGALTGVEESWGVEPSPAAEVAKHHLTRVLQATFDEAEPELPVGFFDLVICNDVIEHLPDHGSFLARIGRYMAPDGMIIGSIPNVRFYNNMFEYLLEKDWHYTDSGVLDRTHLTFFTQKSLRKVLERHGFKVLRLQGINSWYRFSRTARGRAYLIAAFALMVVTLGYFADIRHLQFAFQATPRKT
jgi:2-polyprenyl-3-methyl-5-hydroxy-6-metoxy-1,4-benzoquinol methylase